MASKVISRLETVQFYWKLSNYNEGKESVRLSSQSWIEVSSKLSAYRSCSILSKNWGFESMVCLCKKTNEPKKGSDVFFSFKNSSLLGLNDLTIHRLSNEDKIFFICSFFIRISRYFYIPLMFFLYLQRASDSSGLWARLIGFSKEKMA